MITTTKRPGSVNPKNNRSVMKLQGGFPKMSYFGVKNGLFRPFLGQKTWFQVVFEPKQAILGLFGSKKLNFGFFSHFQPFFAIFVTFLQNHPVLVVAPPPVIALNSSSTSFFSHLNSHNLPWYLGWLFSVHLQLPISQLAPWSPFSLQTRFAAFVSLVGVLVR